MKNPPPVQKNILGFPILGEFKNGILAPLKMTDLIA
jgi:hypothetical protein